MSKEPQQPKSNPSPKPGESASARALPMEELREIAQEIASSYPPPRLGTELVLLEVNPHRAHAYWNIDIEDYRTAAAACGDTAPPLLLRLHDVTGVDFDGSNSRSYFDLQVQGLQGHWYVDLWKDGCSHIAELGLRRADGRFELLARSNVVTTPPATESPHYHTEAVDTAAAEPALRLTDLAADPDLSPENLDAETGAEIPLNPPPLSVVPAPNPDAFRSPDAVIQLDDAGVPFAPSIEPSCEPPASVKDTRSFPMPPGAERHPAVYPPVVPKVNESDVSSGTPSAEPLQQDEERPEWPSAEELARFIPDSPSATFAPPVSNAPAHSAPPTGETADTHPAAVASTPERKAIPDEARPPAPPAPPASLPLENYVALFSAEHGHPQIALEVNVELHIFGRAKPGTQVSFYGQPVPLRPDGSFSLRKPLPHGAVVLPLLAVDPPAPTA